MRASVRARGAGLGDAVLLRQMLDVMSDALVAVDLTGRIMEWNPAAGRLYGWTAGEVVGEQLEHVLAFEVAPTDAALITACVVMGQVWSGRQHVRHRDGATLGVDCRHVPLREQSGEVVGVAYAAARRLDAGAADSLVLVRPDGSVPYMSDVLFDQLGLPRGLEVLLPVLVHPDDQPALVAALDERRGSGIELRLRDRGHEYRLFRFRANDLAGTDPGGLLLTGGAVDAAAAAATAREAEPGAARLGRRARRHEPRGALDVSTDALTGLPDANLLTDRLRGMLSELHDPSHGVAVLAIDVDGFTHLNEVLGRDGGDETLVLLGRRLRRVLRAGETVGRFGADEFAVCAEVDDAADASAIADRITGVLSARAVVEGREIDPSVSVGIAITHDREAEPQDLLREADRALEVAKRERDHRAVVDLERQPRAG